MLIWKKKSTFSPLNVAKQVAADTFVGTNKFHSFPKYQTPFPLRNVGFNRTCFLSSFSLSYLLLYFLIDILKIPIYWFQLCVCLSYLLYFPTIPLLYSTFLFTLFLYTEPVSFKTNHSFNQPIYQIEEWYCFVERRCFFRKVLSLPGIYRSPSDSFLPWPPPGIIRIYFDVKMKRKILDELEIVRKFPVLKKCTFQQFLVEPNHRRSLKCLKWKMDS